MERLIASDPAVVGPEMLRRLRRGTVLGILRTEQWDESAEAPLVDFMNRPTTSGADRRSVIEVLLHRCGEKYVPTAVEFVRAAPSSDDMLKRLSLFNIGNRFFTYSQANQGAILDLGFSILENVGAPGDRSGYFVACRLGYFLKIHNGFKPSTQSPKYRTENGLNLNDRFFADTVQNALAWRKEHPAITDDPRRADDD